MTRFRIYSPKDYQQRAAAMADLKKARKLAKAQKPPGGGWQPIPGGKKGGFRKREGGKWVHWYPNKAKKGGISPGNPKIPDITPPKAMFGREAGTLKVLGATPAPNGQVTIEVDNLGTAKMPKASVRHFVNDLSGVVKEPKSGDRLVDSVIDGKAQFLGKGDDGLAFKSGSSVVKVSTTVPFQPTNPGHRTPAAARAMLKKQVEVGNAMADAGIPALRSRYVASGEKGFQVKPYVDIPEKFTEAQLQEIKAGVEKMHAAGYTMNDTIQAGVTAGGQVVFFDTGKAAKGGSYSTQKDEMDEVKRLFRDSGVEWSGQRPEDFEEKLDDIGMEVMKDPSPERLKELKSEFARASLGFRRAAKKAGVSKDEIESMIDFLNVFDMVEKSAAGRSCVIPQLLTKSGWQPIPGGKKGGSRKRVGGKWVYRYPDQAKDPKQLSIFDRVATAAEVKALPTDAEGAARAFREQLGYGERLNFQTKVAVDVVNGALRLQASSKKHMMAALDEVQEYARSNGGYITRTKLSWGRYGTGASATTWPITTLRVHTGADVAAAKQRVKAAAERRKARLAESAAKKADYDRRKKTSGVIAGLEHDIAVAEAALKVRQAKTRAKQTPNALRTAALKSAQKKLDVARRKRPPVTTRPRDGSLNDLRFKAARLSERLRAIEDDKGLVLKTATVRGVNDALKTGTAKFMMGGMRDLAPFRAAVAGKTPTAVTSMATAMKGPAPFDQPIAIDVEPGAVILKDGRHRLQAAREAGATHILARVTERNDAGQVIGSQELEVATGGSLYEYSQAGGGSLRPRRGKPPS